MAEARILSRPEHPISRKDIDPDVVNILYRLKKNGFEGYLVGGAIRDFLRGVQPKDFDVATDATPHELRHLFRNSRIIGRRFRLVHVCFGPKAIEVATLRAEVDPPEGDESDAYIEDDNCWGTVETDAFRRDFTINGLYYDIDDFSVIDHVGGIADIEAGLIRSIGDPRRRFVEDPVRMLRAIKFAARFDFTFEAETDAALRSCAEEILQASRFRITEEIFRIIMQRRCAAGFRLLLDYGFLHVLYPRWVADLGDEGLAQVADFFDRVAGQIGDERYLPIEVLAAGMFVPYLDHVDVHQDRYQLRSAELVEEVRQVAFEMDLPKRLTASVLSLLKGQLYMLFFAHRNKNILRYVATPEFDWVWRLHDLAFGHVRALQGIQEVWLKHRECLPEPLVGWVDRPDRRDVFSFRGSTGGGRRPRGEDASLVRSDGNGRSGDRRSRRRRRG